MPEENVAQKQEDVANLYDAFDMRVDRHWSEKKVVCPPFQPTRLHFFDDEDSIT